jgi:hypothetical protein
MARWCSAHHFGFNFQTASFADTASRSRRALRASFAGKVLPSEFQKAQGMPGAQRARSLACK